MQRATDLHDVTLQRLGVFHQNNDHPVFYTPEHFAATTDKWNGIPVIFTEARPRTGAEHPDFAAVTAGNLPPGFRWCGSIRDARMTETGEPALKGAIMFDDPAITAMAKAGRLTLSTGFTSPEAPDDRQPGATRIAGPVNPNHVLVFERGACPNCYPNDAGAMFHNTLAPAPEDDRTAVCRMAGEFKSKFGIDIGLPDAEITNLENDPRVKAVLQDATIRFVQQMSGKNVAPPRDEAGRLADRYIAMQVINAVGPEIRARDAVARQSADFEKKFGIRVV